MRLSFIDNDDTANEPIASFTFRKDTLVERWAIEVTGRGIRTPSGWFSKNYSDILNFSYREGEQQGEALFASYAFPFWAFDFATDFLACIEAVGFTSECTTHVEVSTHENTPVNDLMITDSYLMLALCRFFNLKPKALDGTGKYIADRTQSEFGDIIDRLDTGLNQLLWQYPKIKRIALTLYDALGKYVFAHADSSFGVTKTSKEIEEKFKKGNVSVFAERLFARGYQGIARLENCGVNSKLELISADNYTIWISRDSCTEKLAFDDSQRRIFDKGEVPTSTENGVALNLQLMAALRTDIYFIPLWLGISHKSNHAYLIIHGNQGGYLNPSNIMGLIRKAQSLCSQVMQREGALLLNQMRVSQIKSAIGSIMSRNGSHNIGSHVLAALSHNVGTMPDDRVLYQYIQHRMDYIATVTTDFPTWTQPTMFVGELMRDFYSQRHLLDHIAESEGLSAWEFQNPDLSDEETCGQHGKIKLRIRHKRRGASPVEVVNFRKGGEIANMLKEDVALAIPGGVIGNHAFYTILENIIRNAAKHGWSKLSPTDRKEANLEVTIDYEDCKECIEFTIWDNQSDLATDETLLARQKDRIKQPFIDGEGRLRRENWGMAEIKISAGYLAGRAIGEIGGLDQRKEADSQKEDWIVEPCAVRDEIDGKEVLHLGYRFTVEKPRDVVFVLDTAQKEQEELWNLVKERTTEFRASGIVFEPWEEGGKKLTDKTAGKSKFAARYVVLPEFGEAQKIGPWPFRVLTWGKPSACNDLVGQVRLDDIRKILERDGGARSLREEVEKAWLFHLMGKKSLQKDRFAIVVNTEAGESGGGRGLITNADVLRFVFTNGLRTAVETFFETHGGKVSDDTALALWALHALPPPKQPLNVGENDKVVSSIAWELLARLTPLGQEEFRQQCKSRFERSLERLLKRLQGRCPQVLLKRPPNWWEQVKTIQTYLECAYGHPKKEEYGKHRAIFPTWNGCPKNGENLWRQFRGHPHEIAKFVQHLSNVFCEADVFLRKYEERITTLPTGFSTSTRTTGGGAPEDREVCGIKIQSQSIPEESKTEAVFFRHFQPKAENNPSGLIYQEPLSGTQSYFNAIAGMAQDFGGQGDGDVWVAKMAECALLKVCVADERAAKFLRDHPTVRNTYGVENILVLDDKWAEEQLASKEAVPECNPSLASAGNSTPSRDDATGLFQPKEIVNLLRDACGYVRDLRELPPDPPPDGWVRERIEQWQTEGGGLRYTKFREEVVAPNFDILILHQGLIDKWLGETSHLKGHIAVFLGILKLYVKYVVITTGRGTPANIPPRARVLPFPTLESSLFRMYPEKLVLVDTIMNILPVGEESN